MQKDISNYTMEVVEQFVLVYDQTSGIVAVRRVLQNRISQDKNLLFLIDFAGKLTNLTNLTKSPYLIL